jgi:hypothetical protein
MKKIIISGLASLSLIFILSTSFGQSPPEFEEGGKKCRTGERCPSGTYKYCDDLGSGEICGCYACKPPVG